MKLIKIDHKKAEKMYYVLYSFCLNRGIETFRLKKLFDKNKLLFSLVAELADTNSASYKDWVAAQFAVMAPRMVTINPAVLYSKAAKERYKFYMQRKLKESSPEAKEIYFFEFVKLMSRMRKISFTEALELAVRLHFISVRLYPKLLARYKESKGEMKNIR